MKQTVTRVSMCSSYVYMGALSMSELDIARNNVPCQSAPHQRRPGQDA
jgi:hypothetical protein